MGKTMLQLAILAQYGSQKNFAEKLGLSELTVSQVICKRRKLSEEDQTQWSQVLRTPKKLLFGEVKGGA